MIFNEPITTEQILALGDTHSIDVVSTVINGYNISNCILIHVGDIGIGFAHIEKDTSKLNWLNNLCVEKNIKFLGLRGNHDSPNYFHPDHQINKTLSNVELVEDYSIKTINDKKFLFAGGAVSIDRQYRTEGKDYWRGEKFVLPDNLETLEQCDVLISHTCTVKTQPYGFDNIKGWFKNDPKLKDDLIKERKDISTLVKQVNPSINVFGHYHTVIAERIDGIFYRGLDINEIVSVTNYLK